MDSNSSLCEFTAASSAQLYDLLGYNAFGLRSSTDFSVVVYCSSSNVSQEWKDIATALVDQLYAMNATLVTGGGGGLMEIMTKHMLALGGKTRAVMLEGLSCPRPYHDHPELQKMWAKSMPERRCALSSSCDAAVALCGGAGTLEEVAELWASRKLGWHDKPVILLNHKGFWQGLIMQLQAMVDAGALSTEGRDAISVCGDVQEASQVLALARQRKDASATKDIAGGAGEATAEGQVSVVAEEENAV